VPVVLVLYGRQGRWSGALGWSMLVGGVAALSLGAGGSFAWGGLAFLGLTAMGGLLLAMDVLWNRRRRVGRR
jgi:hypothetical protein